MGRRRTVSRGLKSSCKVCEFVGYHHLVDKLVDWHHRVRYVRHSFRGPGKDVDMYGTSPLQANKRPALFCRRRERARYNPGASQVVRSAGTRCTKSASARLACGPSFFGGFITERGLTVGCVQRRTSFIAYSKLDPRSRMSFTDALRHPWLDPSAEAPAAHHKRLH